MSFACLYKQYSSIYVAFMFSFQLRVPFHFNVGGGIGGRNTCSSIPPLVMVDIPHLHVVVMAV